MANEKKRLDMEMVRSVWWERPRRERNVGRTTSTIVMALERTKREHRTLYYVIPTEQQRRYAEEAAQMYVEYMNEIENHRYPSGPYRIACNSTGIVLYGRKHSDPTVEWKVGEIQFLYANSISALEDRTRGLSDNQFVDDLGEWSDIVLPKKRGAVWAIMHGDPPPYSRTI